VEILKEDLVFFLPEVIEYGAAEVLSITIEISKAFLEGKLRCALRPLLTRNPVVGALQVSTNYKINACIEKSFRKQRATCLAELFHRRLLSLRLPSLTTISTSPVDL
jgi:hypothetical protein